MTSRPTANSRRHDRVFFARDDRGMQHFADDDSGNLGWLGDHPEGFVLNTTQTPSAAYLMLHRATCWTNSAEAGMSSSRRLAASAGLHNPAGTVSDSSEAQITRRRPIATPDRRHVSKFDPSLPLALGRSGSAPGTGTTDPAIDVLSESWPNGGRSRCCTVSSRLSGGRSSTTLP